jgi:hypothetical protein
MDSMSSSFLPPLKSQARVKPGEAGKWQPQAGIAYTEVADSLTRPEIGTNTQSISSIPDMWARPLLVDMVLRDQEYPLHSAIKAQWKGMLAAIALAEVKRLKLQAQLLDLDTLQADALIKALIALSPSSQRTVYQSTEKIRGENRNPWHKIYVFLLNGQSVGMTSPATLVCPAEEGNWEGIPWYADGRLHSPLDSSEYLTEDDKIQLWLWLDNLKTQLDSQRGVDSAKLKELLNEYKNELAQELTIDPKGQTFRPSKNVAYFGVPLTLGGLDALNIPIQAKRNPSSVRILALGKSMNEEVIFIPDLEQLKKQWPTKQSVDIWIHDTVSAAIFDKAEFTKQYKGKVKFLTEDDIFTKTFFYLEGEGNLPGALLPEDTKEITYTADEQERHLTPLLPLKRDILNYFSSEELIKRLAFNPTTIGNQSAVRVSLTLPLSGGDFTIHREYPIEVNNAITAKPFLEIWPNFKAPNWKAYYALYFDDRTEATKQNKIFRAVFTEAIEIHPPELKNFQITRLESFPDYILCQDETEIYQGLILLKTPPKVGDQNPNKTWTVGVDFGTSFTNVYYQINNVRDAVTLTPLHLQITQAMGRFNILYDYFMWGQAKKFPLSSVLTIRGGKGAGRPVLDGRVYIPKDVREFDPTQDDIKTGLKWMPENIAYNRTFLKHLALLITAEAAKNHVKKINWSISYPSAFSRSDKNLYKVTWQRIIEDLGKTTGIDHKWLDIGNPYRTESLALAHYFADEEEGKEKHLLYTTCLDMGGGTSDISIWENGLVIHQCSVQIAGRLLFSQFWKNRPDFLNQQFLNKPAYKVDTDLSNIRDEPFFVKLEGLLAAEGSQWLERNRTLMDDDPDLQTIVQLSTLGISGLYYYIGLVLRALDVEKKYTRKLNTPVYIGGNGSRILNWLDLSGRFSPDSEASLLFSRLLSKASGFENKKVPTVLSSKPKAEVACGLVLDQSKRKNLSSTGLQDDDEVIFAGEDCEVNGVAFGWQDRLDLTQFERIESFKLVGSDDEEVGLANLQKFLEDFQQAFKELKITSIKPLRPYDDAQWRSSLWTTVKDSVESNLRNLAGRNSEDVSVEPPFILGLKALLKELNSTL